MSHSVSIIIPCYNAAPWIGETLRSALAQELGDLEVIVVDDGSTDGSADIVAREFPAVHLVRTPNGGPSKARNLGTALASGDFIQYLDADDLLAPGKLTVQLAALHETGADVAYGDWQRLSCDGDGVYRQAELAARRIEGSAEIALFTDFWCPPAAYLYRRTIIERIGGWNEGLPVIQDARFALDAALRGGNFVYTPRLMAWYRQHRKGSVSSRNQTTFIRDVYTNAVEVEAWWQANGGITQLRRKTLVHVYAHAAQFSFAYDQPTFDLACTAIERHDRRFISRRSPLMMVMSALFGYRRAEALALKTRQMRRQVGLVSDPNVTR